MESLVTYGCKACLNKALRVVSGNNNGNHGSTRYVLDHDRPPFGALAGCLPGRACTVDARVISLTTVSTVTSYENDWLQLWAFWLITSQTVGCDQTKTIASASAFGVG